MGCLPCLLGGGLVWRAGLVSGYFGGLGWVCTCCLRALGLHVDLLVSVRLFCV